MKPPITAILERVYQTILADKESNTGRDGYASYRAEWHSLAWGLACGFLSGVTGDWMFLIAGVGWLFTRAGDRGVPKRIPWGKQLVKESGYVVGHAGVGLLIGILVNNLLVV